MGTYHSVVSLFNGTALTRVYTSWRPRSLHDARPIFVALAATAANFSLALVIALAVVDGTLAIAARTFTRASAAAVLSPSGQLRSEEHTSELQSLMRISYAVFGLQQKPHKCTTSLSPTVSSTPPNREGSQPDDR